MDRPAHMHWVLLSDTPGKVTPAPWPADGLQPRFSAAVSAAAEGVMMSSMVGSPAGGRSGVSDDWCGVSASSMMVGSRSGDIPPAGGPCPWSSSWAVFGGTSTLGSDRSWLQRLDAVGSGARSGALQKANRSCSSMDCVAVVRSHGHGDVGPAPKLRPPHAGRAARGGEPAAGGEDEPERAGSPSGWRSEPKVPAPSMEKSGRPAVRSDPHLTLYTN